MEFQQGLIWAAPALETDSSAKRIKGVHGVWEAQNAGGKVGSVRSGSEPGVAPATAAPSLELLLPTRAKTTAEPKFLGADVATGGSEGEQRGSSSSPWTETVSTNPQGCVSAEEQKLLL